jgi:DsbC/DsbD-like thiol-disulfide interchange protein
LSGFYFCDIQGGKFPMLTNLFCKLPRQLTCALVVLACAVSFPGQQSVGQSPAKKGSAAKVTVQANATKTDAAGNQQITMKLTIEKGWHIYANPLDNADLKGNETKVTVTGQAKPLDVKTAYPAGKLVTVHGQTARIYEGEVTLTTTVRRASGDNAALQVTIDVNACNATSCLPSGEIKLSVPSYNP